jgi:hypothetical protein
MELMRRIGSITQVGGLRIYDIADGMATGVRAIDFRTGSGLCFTVLPGRGMDIGWAEYRGIPLAYISKTGVVSSSHFESEGMGGLGGFFGGLLTTCGLSNVGPPCHDEHHILGTRSYGIHGRISNVVAENVCTRSIWEGDTHWLIAEGVLRQAVLHGENLTLHRKYITRLGADSFRIHDTIRNEGFASEPLMLLYHFNVGYPLLDSCSRFHCDSEAIMAADRLSDSRIEKFHQMEEPTNGARENLYFHRPRISKDGRSNAQIFNPELGLGLRIRYNPSQLPNLVQWKMMGESEYVLGIEPSNCLPLGREAVRRNGGLAMLEPGEERKFDLEVSILEQEGIEEDDRDAMRTPAGEEP